MRRFYLSGFVPDLFFPLVIISINIYLIDHAYLKQAKEVVIKYLFFEITQRSLSQIQNYS